MSEQPKPIRKPLLGLAVFVTLCLVLIGAVLIWQQVRWTFAAPLAVAFHEHNPENGNAVLNHAEIRKFLTLDVSKIDELAQPAGFECAQTSQKFLTVCYRDVWSGVCNELWSLEFIYDDKNKVTEANGRKRRVCLFQY